jgi:hypothetical protein
MARRFFLLALVGAMLLPLPVGAAPEASTNHYAVDQLEADWILPTDTADEFKYIVVRVSRRTNLDTGKERLSGAVGRGSCIENDVAFACQALLEPYNISEFEADRSLSSARIVLRRGRLRHTVQFTATTPFVWVPPVGEEPNFCGGTTKVVYLTGRNATAEGRVFGRRVSTADEYDAQRTAEMIVQTLEIEECT